MPPSHVILILVWVTGLLDGLYEKSTPGGRTLKRPTWQTFPHDARELHRFKVTHLRGSRAASATRRPIFLRRVCEVTWRGWDGVGGGWNQRQLPVLLNSFPSSGLLYSICGFASCASPVKTENARHAMGDNGQPVANTKNK